MTKTLPSNTTYRIYLLKSRSTALIARAKNLAPNETIKVMCSVHVYPYLAYCYSGLLPLPATYNINILRKKIIRILTNSDFLAHTPDVFKSMEMFQLSDTSRLSVTTYMFKHGNNNHMPITQLHH